MEKKRPSRARRTWPTKSWRATPWSAHQRSTRETTTPSAPVQRNRRCSVVLAELDEIEDFLEELTDLAPAVSFGERGANPVAQAQRALESGGAGEKEGIDL